MGVYVYAGAINRPLQLRTVCNNAANKLQYTHVHPRNATRNTPPGVGADSSCPYPNITKYTYPHYQIRISTSPHTHFLLHYVGVYVYAGTINRPLQLLTDCDNAANKLQYTHVHPRKTILSHRKHHTFTPQKPYFRTANTMLLHHKNHTFTPQIPTFYTAKTYRRQIGRVAKTFC